MADEHDHNNGPDHGDGQEFSEFLFGPNPRDDGSIPDDEEERRRQAKLKYELARLAHKHGINISTDSVRPAEPMANSPRAAEIEQIAKVVMPERNQQVKTTLRAGKMSLPDGTKFSAISLELGCLDGLGEAFKSLLNPLGLKDAVVSLSKRVIAIRIRVGPMRLEARFSEPKTKANEPAEAE